MPEEKEEIKIRIKKIRELEFSYKEILDEVDEIEFGKNLFFGLNFLYEPDLDKNTFTLKTHIKYTLKDQREPVLVFLNEIVFDVLGLNDAVKFKKDSNEFEINNNLLIPLISVAIGTTRGMIVSKTIGKKINDFPVPMLNPEEVLKQINKRPT